ncbi:mannose-6-phosphatase [Vararia minispora EC-137]|uniref:Mannose-6-phosphatase n=1 Tax=Vararia minispora EC-137 TaxID=1314806 RepID=A0ACB8QY70_9AGAM|nr:mannose-6-phosphatase [Vararia minispora EC-137]
MTQGSVRLMTWNIRYDSQPDNVTVQETVGSLPDPLTEPVSFLNLTGEQPWSTRRIRVYQRIIGEDVDMIGFQEALERQYDDMHELLGDNWGCVGVGRDDGAVSGEFSPIYWKKSIFTLLSNDTFWLSETPFDAGSKYTNAGSVRIATAAHFLLNASGKRFTYINTHLDDQSDKQRQYGASLILWRARSEASRGSTVIVSGDFNSPTVGNEAGAYRIITGQISPLAVNQTFQEAYAVHGRGVVDFKMLDLRTQLPSISVAGNWATYTGFNGPEDTREYSQIDFIFGGNNGGWNPILHKIETQLTDDGVLASDHRPVIADLQI